MTRRRRHRPNRRHLEDYERTVVLRKVREQGWARFRARDLMRVYPDVFNERYLRAALNRMARHGHLRRSRKWAGVQYEVREGRAADSPTRSAA